MIYVTLIFLATLMIIAHFRWIMALSFLSYVILVLTGVI